LVVYETIAALPAICLVSYLLDRLKRTKKNPDAMSDRLQLIFASTSPAVLFYHTVFRLIVLLICRLKYGRFYEPRLLSDI